MAWWRQIVRGIGALVKRENADRDVADEVAHFLAEARADLLASGLTAAEARRHARLRFGDAAALREQVRAHGWENRVESFALDLRHAVRRLGRSPGFAFVAVLTLALGIGTGTAIVSAVNAVLLRPLPYPEADRIVLIDDRTNAGAPVDVTYGTFREIEERSRALAAAAALKPWQPTLTGEDEPERLEGQRVGARYFDVIGVRPTLGSGFDAADDRAGGPDVVILSDALWRQRFGSDSAIVGRQIRLDDRPFTVVGVMPRGFEDALAPRARVWALLQYDPTLPSHDGREWGHHLRMVGRLGTGGGAAALRAELDVIARDPVPAFVRPPWASMEQGMLVRELRAAIVGGVRPTLLAVLGAASLLLLIACVNVVNLLLARGAQRRGEFALRSALGADGGRLVRQLVTESLLLAFLGGLAGLVVAAIGVRALVALGPADLPRLDTIRLDGASFAIALALTTLVALGVGLAPAPGLARRDVRTGLRHGTARATGGNLATRRALVIAEFALALVLLVAAGLLLRSVQRIFATPPGFEAAGVVVMQVQTSGRHLERDTARHLFFQRALDAVMALPGVEAAAFTSQLPLSGQLDQYGIRLAGDDREPREAGSSAFRYTVTPGYFDALEVPILRGRRLDPLDAAGAPLAILVNETFARRAFPATDPIGQRVHVGGSDLPPHTIVGVVGDVKQASLAAGPADAFYTTPGHMYFSDRAMWLVVRTRGDAPALVPTLRAAIRSVDPDQPIVRVTTMERLVADSEPQRRFALAVFQIFGALALVLAVIGIFGVLSAIVAERTREIGVRSALGASRSRILVMVVGEGIGMVALGALLGLAASAIASRTIASLLFGITPFDLVTYVGVTAVLAGAALIACCVPASRAVRVEPAITLRSD